MTNRRVREALKLSSAQSATDHLSVTPSFRLPSAFDRWTALPVSLHIRTMRRSTILALVASAMCPGPLGGARLVAQAGDQPKSLIPAPIQPEKPFAALSRAILEGRDSLSRLPRQPVGLRYRYGALRPGTAFDCSGLVKWVMSMFDLHLPRTAAEQARLGLGAPKDTPTPPTSGRASSRAKSRPRTTAGGRARGGSSWTRTPSRRSSRRRAEPRDQGSGIRGSSPPPDHRPLPTAHLAPTSTPTSRSSTRRPTGTHWSPRGRG